MAVGQLLTKSRFPAINMVTLFAAFGEMLDLHTETMQMPAAEKPILVEDYPRQKLGTGYDTAFDVILMKIVSILPAQQGNQGRRDLGWKIAIEPSPKAGYLVRRSVWQEEVVVQFEVLSKSNQRANELADWFHRTVVYWANGMRFFSARGVNWFRFVQRLEDRTNKEYGQELYSRPLQYVLRLECCDLSEIKTLESVDLAVGLPVNY